MNNSPIEEQDKNYTDPYYNPDILDFLVHNKQLDIDSVVSNPDYTPNHLTLRKNAIKNMIINETVLFDFLDKLDDLYSSTLLTNLSVKELSPTTRKSIDKLAGLHLFSRTKHTNKRFGTWSATPEEDFYLYMMILKFVSWVESILQTPLTNKIPNIFKENNLITLKNQLDKNPSDDLKSICKKANQKYYATFSALNEYFNKHPNHVLISQERFFKTKEYGRIKKILKITSKEDIRKWAIDVQNLLI